MERERESSARKCAVDDQYNLPQGRSLRRALDFRIGVRKEFSPSSHFTTFQECWTLKMAIKARFCQEKNHTATESGLHEMAVLKDNSVNLAVRDRASCLFSGDR